MSRPNLAIRILLLLSIVLFSLPGAPALAQGATVVRVDPAASTVKVNDSFVLSVKVDNIVNLTALELHMVFNATVLEVTSVANGGFIAADFVAQNVFDNGAGTIDYAVAQMNRTPAAGNGVLVSITFRAKANGLSNLALRATQAVPNGMLLSDQNGSSIQASWADGSVTVGTAPVFTNTPVPTTAVPPTAVPPTVTPGGPTVTTAPTATKTATAAPTTSGAPTATPVPAQPGSILGTHVVRWGESLYCIGRAYKVTPWAIADTNGVWWPYIIFPGQNLRIPNVVWSPIPSGPVCKAQFTGNGTTPTATPAATPTKVSPTATAGGPTATPTAIVPTATTVPGTVCRAYYIVQRGDNLFRIALRYGTTYDVLARVNNIANPRLIYVGQQLCIP